MDTKEKNRKTPSGKGRPVRSGGIATKKAAPPRGKAAVKQTKRQRKPSPKRPTADVVYTQPGPFNIERFLLHLATAVAVVLALLFGMSIFFKVDTVEVTGIEKYTAWDVKEASGIQEGDSLLTLNEAKINSLVIAKLPYVDKVRVGIKLPDTVKIEVTEMNVAYAVEAEDGSWWLMGADGGIVEKTNSADAELYTKVLGVKIAAPAVGEKAQAAQPAADATAQEGETVPVTVQASQQLDVAVSILQYLEACGVLGQMASVDVSDLGDIELWYGERYQVTVGDSTQLSRKIGSMKAAIDKMDEYQKGNLDVSFTTWPDEVGYTPFT